MGRHVAEGRRRGIASWPLVALGVIAVLVLGTIAYFAALRSDNQQTATACGGEETLPILASGGSAVTSRALAEAFNATKPEARSTCITTVIYSLTGPDASRAMQTAWSERTEPPPALWITDNLTDLLAAEQKNANLTAGRSEEPVATSPVVLAAPAELVTEPPAFAWADLGTALGANGTIRAKSGAGLPLLLPDPRSNRASSYALESALGGDGTLTAQEALVGAKAIAESVKPVVPLPTTADALDSLASGTVGVTPVTEAELARYNDDHGNALIAIRPTGPTVGDEMFLVGLTATWVTPTVRDAASQFQAFVIGNEGQQILRSAHLRISESVAAKATGEATASATPQPTAARQPAASAEVATAFAEAFGFGGVAATTSDAPTPGSGGSTPGSAPPGSASTPGAAAPPQSTAGSTPPSASGAGSVPVSDTFSPPASDPTGFNVTMVVDTSTTWSTEVDGQTRLQWLRQALTGLMSSGTIRTMGLWAASSDYSDGYSVEVPTGSLDAALPDGNPRAIELRSAIEGLSAGGSRHYYGALPVALNEVGNLATDGQQQLVVLITDGPDQTPSTPRSAVLQQIQNAIGPNPIRLIILGVGEAAPDSALTDLADAGGGTYVDVPSTTNLPDALLQAVRDSRG